MMQQMGSEEGWEQKLNKPEMKMYVKKDSMFCQKCPFFKVKAVFPVKDAFHI